MPEPKPAHPGGLRQLEPELPSVLAVEPLPATNLIIATDPEEPPPRVVNPPGPFTDEELLPAGLYEEVVSFGVTTIQSVDRACRGGQHAWRAAKALRPASRTYTEEQALNSPARGGFTYSKHEDGLWHVIQPSSFPDDPPDTDLDIVQFEELAERHGLRDHQLRSWIKHGMPGAREMPIFAQLAASHVGALKFAETYVELSKKDGDAEYVTKGFSFPDIWPCVVDPMNVVMQKGKGRVTIDKTMHISGDPELPSYNLCIDLPVHEAGRRYALVRMWQYGRAAAILGTSVALTPQIQVLEFSMDLEAFFRKHGKQRKYLYQSGRLVFDGFGHDRRVNFGERDAPDHTGRASNAVTFFARRELKRLEKEYATVVPELIAWLADRAARRPSDLCEEDDFLWSVLFFLMTYVDDKGGLAVNDPLVDSRGRRVIIIETAADGSVARRQQHRAQLYFAAIIGVIEYVGHRAPQKKRVLPCRDMVLLGTGCDLDRALRYLSSDKQLSYGEHVMRVLAAPRLPNGALRWPLADFNSLVHRLLHASEVVPLGRSHLFSCLEVLRQINRLSGEECILGKKPVIELEWWHATLAAPFEYAIPLASRESFPNTSEDGVLTHYGDASREFDEESGVAALSSGFGAWTVIEQIFYYIEGRWTHAECKAFSINVLEFATEIFGAVVFTAQSRSVGVEVTHVHTLIDNTCAEHVSERGRTKSGAINELNSLRHDWLVAEGVHQQASRVASVFNDVADLLSRGDIDDALRFAEEANLPVIRLDVPSSLRDLSALTPTWA